MNNIKDELETLESIIKGIAVQFGEKCEVVLHDLSGDYEKTIVAIENGYITGRKVGDCGSNLGLEVLMGTEKNGDRYNYITQLKEGTILRSSSIYLKDDDGKTIGAICINMDISDLIMAEKAIQSTILNKTDPEIEEVFVRDVNELLSYLIQQCQKQIGKPVIHMSKEDKMKVVEFLDKKGAFLITKSGDKVCRYLDISKFTLYNYLDEIHSNNTRLEQGRL
jgi:predicted transcriptional regulator YheO